MPLCVPDITSNWESKLVFPQYPFRNFHISIAIFLKVIYERCSLTLQAYIHLAGFQKLKIFLSNGLARGGSPPAPLRPKMERGPASETFFVWGGGHCPNYLHTYTLSVIKIVHLSLACTSHFEQSLLAVITTMATRKWRIHSFTQSPTQGYFKTTHEINLQITSICCKYSTIYNT
jgi:hypothetical protein